MLKHRYLPMTEQDREEMLEAVGVENVEELFADIPEKVRFKGEYGLKPAKAEGPLMRELERLSSRNADSRTYASFLGAGVYDHYMPVVVDHVISRSEFYTAYTPYQPEISQGELQAIFEFQTMIAELTGMDAANSSMYDGGTALAEAATLSCGSTKRKKIAVSETVHPEYRAVLRTYAKGQHIEVIEVPSDNGVTDLRALEQAMDENLAGVIVQYPNFFGRVEDLVEIEKLAHLHKGMFIVCSNPLALGVLTPPGRFGADIVIGDAQPFGIPAAFGGPHCGYFAVTKKLIRKVPGRLVGQTVDDDGQRGFVLTLQAREQHIRRDKATSNICSNQALNALAASVAMSALGKKGVKEMAVLNIQKAFYAKEALKSRGIIPVFEGASFNEFIIKLPVSYEICSRKLLENGMLAGYHLGLAYPDLKDHMLVAVTEQRTKEEIDAFADELGGLL